MAEPADDADVESEEDSSDDRLTVIWAWSKSSAKILGLLLVQLQS
jgi:hypothetical protein